MKIETFTGEYKLLQSGNIVTLKGDNKILFNIEDLNLCLQFVHDKDSDTKLDSSVEDKKLTIKITHNNKKGLIGVFTPIKIATIQKTELYLTFSAEKGLTSNNEIIYYSFYTKEVDNESNK